jgi:hypothetical protein
MNKEMKADHEISLKYAKFLYHGTIKTLVNRISFAKGLIPSENHRFDKNFIMSKENCLYLTTSLARAIYWARLISDRQNDEPILLRIAKEDIIGMLSPDENLEWDETSFQIQNGQIKTFKVIESKDFLKEMDIAYGNGKELLMSEKMKIWDCIEHNRGFREPRFI